MITADRTDYILSTEPYFAFQRRTNVLPLYKNWKLCPHKKEKQTIIFSEISIEQITTVWRLKSDRLIMIETSTTLQLRIRRSEKNKSENPISERLYGCTITIWVWRRKVVEDVRFSGDAKLPALILVETDTVASGPRSPSLPPGRVLLIDGQGDGHWPLLHPCSHPLLSQKSSLQFCLANTTASG